MVSFRQVPAGLPYFLCQVLTPHEGKKISNHHCTLETKYGVWVFIIYSAELKNNALKITEADIEVI